MIIGEWPVCEPAPVRGARLLGWPLVACRGAQRVGAGVLEKHPRAARRIPRGSSLCSAGCQPPPLDAGFCCAGQGARHRRPRRGASKKNAAALRRKKGHPPSFVLLVAPTHRKIILSSVVATSTFYARTQVRSRLRTQLFEKVAKNEKVAKSRQ